MQAHSTPEMTLSRRSISTAFLVCFLFAFSLRASTGAYLVGLLGILLWCHFHRDKLVPLLPHPIYFSAGLLTLSIGLHALILAPQSPAPLFQTLDNYLDNILLLAFIPLSFVFYQLRHYLYWILLFPAIAVLIRVLHRTDIQALQDTLFREGPFGFGTHHVPFGLQCAMAILILVNAIFLTPSLRLSRAKEVALPLALGCLTLLLIQAQLTSSSRSGWLSLALGLIALALCMFKRKTHSASPSTNTARARIAFVSLLSGLVVGLVVLNSAAVGKRIKGATSVEFQFTLDVEQLPRDKDVFFARRLHLAHFGWQKIAQKPMFGHGPASIEALLDQDPDFHTNPHLHNTYVQLLVELGILGSLLLLLPLALLCYYTAKRLTERSSAGDPALGRHSCLLLSATLVLIMWSAMDNHFHQADYRFLVTWYAALAACMLRATRN